jgi:UDP-N-acetylglucosamine 4,6-dehydratase
MNYWISGAGSWSKAIINRLLNGPPGTDHIVAYCRSEERAAHLLRMFHDNRLTIYLGDVRDDDRVCYAMRGSEYVIHTAAMKRVDSGLYSPTEMSSVNIEGTKIVIRACIEQQIKRSFYIGTDKSCFPSTFYGATKLVAESLWLSADAVSETDFVAARFGNALGSTGSVLEVWQRCIQEGKPLPVRFGGEATRFVLTLKEGAKAVDWFLHNGESGKILAPELPTTTIYNLARAVAGDDYPLIWEDVIPGEKKHEQLISHHPTSAEGEHLTVDELRQMLKEVEL